MRACLLVIAFMISLAAPARAADDAADARSVITSQVEAFSRDDAATAYGFASPLLHELFPQAPRPTRRRPTGWKWTAII